MFRVLITSHRLQLCNEMFPFGKENKQFASLEKMGGFLLRLRQPNFGFLKEKYCLKLLDSGESFSPLKQHESKQSVRTRFKPVYSSRKIFKDLTC